MRKTLSEPVAPRKKRGRQMIGDEKRASISATLSKESFDTMDKIVKAGFAKSYSMSIDHALAFYEANQAKMQFDLPKEIKSKIIFEAYKAGLSPDQYIAQLLSTSKI